MSPELLREMFHYYPKTGRLRWKKRPLRHFRDEREWKAFNAAVAGRWAGVKNLNRRKGKVTQIRVNIKKRSHCVHRIVWIMHHGPIQNGLFIDHKDCDPTNNRLDNLRLASRSQNAHNSLLRKDNTSGYKGVSKYRNVFKAEIGSGGKRRYLGCFSSPKEASDARRKASEEIHGKFARQA